MAGGKETPRQKMIGMMYLVLTALLALNVSKEILDAFVTINNGLETTKVTFDGKLSQTYSAFEASYSENRDKYGPAWEKAQQLRTEANELVAHIDKIKAKTIAETEGIEDPLSLIGTNELGVDTVMSLRYVNNKDNYDVNTNIMIGAEPDKPRDDADPDGYNYRAVELKNRLVNFREMVKGMVAENQGLVKSIDSLFTFPEKIRDASGTMTSWEALNFYHVPLAATTTILSKLQSDIRNAESDVLNQLFAGVEAASFRFTTLAPLVVPQKTYVLEGDTFRAEVFLAAFDETKPPTVLLGQEGAEEFNSSNAEQMEVKNGKGIVRIPARGIGDKQWQGVIKFKDPTGKEIDYPYSLSYEVAKPSLVVSPIKMNVLYRGIDNPVAISVPGLSADAITPSIDNGTLVKQSDGTYLVKDLKSGTTANISVSADVNGQKKNMGSVPFRVKAVPDPVAKFAGKTSADSKASKAEITAALGVIADLKDFEFDLKYPVTSFEVTVIIGGDVKTLKSTSNMVTPDMKQLFQQLRKNQVVLIENIRAKAPDGTIRSLGSINLKII